MDRGTWWATAHGVTKSRTRLNDLTFSRSKWIHLHDLAKGTTCVPPGFKDTWVCVPIYSYHRCYTSEKAMAPHSSTLAWKIPWAEEPGRLQSMGSLRVGHNLEIIQQQLTYRLRGS